MTTNSSNGDSSNPTIIEAKLVVLGNTSVGKSSILQQFLYQAFTGQSEKIDNSFGIEQPQNPLSLIFVPSRSHDVGRLRLYK